MTPSCVYQRANLTLTSPPMTEPANYTVTGPITRVAGAPRSDAVRERHRTTERHRHQGSTGIAANTCTRLFAERAGIHARLPDRVGADEPEGVSDLRRSQIRVLENNELEPRDPGVAQKAPCARRIRRVPG
jgi:hypothetical protein